MKWSEYSRRFEDSATQNGYSKNEIDSLLSYAKNLFDKKLPIIYDQRHLSLLVGYKEDFLYRISNSSQSFYRKFKIPKKSGGLREISEPLPSLKEIQNWILREILNKCQISGYAKAYAHKRSIKENAKFHLRKKIILTIDIKDFFPSLRYKLVLRFFSSLGYSPAVSTMLSKLCCNKDSLPQGAPTSPALSNLLMVNIDKTLSVYIKGNNLCYTRYADDMTFSGDLHPGKIIELVDENLSKMGLSINHKKIRVRQRHQSQEVTGIVVNDKLQVPRTTRKYLRQNVYYIMKYGLASHLEKTENKRANHILHLLGIANFILFINPEDEEVSRFRTFLREYI
jgi:RNA-directed DNA polymerase